MKNRKNLKSKVLPTLSFLLLFPTNSCKLFEKEVYLSERSRELTELVAGEDRYLDYKDSRKFLDAFGGEEIILINQGGISFEPKILPISGIEILAESNVGYDVYTSHGLFGKKTGFKRIGFIKEEQVDKTINYLDSIYKKKSIIRQSFLFF